MCDYIRRSLFLTVLVVGLLTLFGAATARAQGFISPFIGYDFSGDSGCPELQNCNDKKPNFGVMLGAMGNVFGFEEEFGYAKDFFRTAPATSSSVITVMSNLMIVPKIGPVRPYVVAGFGLMRTTALTTLLSLQVSDNNNVGYDLGGGIMVFFGSHVGIRGDIRGYRSLQDLKVFGVVIGDTKLNFGRADAGLVLKF